MTSGMPLGFIVWIVTTQCVNFAFYLSVTNVACGWPRTLGAYLIYFALLAGAFPLTPLVHGDAQGSAGALSLTFISYFALWSCLTMAMSRGVPGRRFFSIVLCGIHQLIAIPLSLLLMHHLRSTVLGPLLASVLMAALGCFLIAWVRPRVQRMPDKSGWLYLNILAASLFVLLYSAGIWPIYVATESAEHTLLFCITAAIAFIFFPTALVFSEKSSQAASFASVEDNLRLMAKELDSRCEIVASARQIRNDRRNRRETLANLLRQGKVQEALDYLSRLAETDGTSEGDSVWCENETVNALLSGYSRKAAAAGLHFSAMADINVRTAQSEVEIVELVSNFLEIAFKTASPSGDVTCLIRLRENLLGVTVSNSVAPDFRLTAEGMPLAGHDVNLENVTDLARKLGGECRCQIDNGLLKCEALLNIGDQHAPI